MSTLNDRQPRGFVLYFPISTEPTVPVETDVCYSKITRVNSKDSIPAFSPVDFVGAACDSDEERNRNTKAPERDINIDSNPDPESLFTKTSVFESSSDGEPSYWCEIMFSGLTSRLREPQYDVSALETTDCCQEESEECWNKGRWAKDTAQESFGKNTASSLGLKDEVSTNVNLKLGFRGDVLVTGRVRDSHTGSNQRFVLIQTRR